MTEVNISKAKKELSKLVAMLENKEEDKIIISKGKTPVAVLMPYGQTQKLKLGMFKGKYIIPDNIDEYNDEALRLLASTKV